MAKLIYATPTSLDGYIADDGNFEWAAPDDEVFAYITGVLRPSAYFFMDAGRTRRWPSGRRRTSFPV